jgi:hypothetical protein
MRVILTNLRDDDDVFVAETNNIDHTASVSPDGRVYIFDPTDDDEIWRGDGEYVRS